MTLLPRDPFLAELLDLARDLTARAGAIQRDRYETELRIDTKISAIDLVTEVDRACEALIVDGIQSARSCDAILAEVRSWTGRTRRLDSMDHRPARRHHEFRPWLSALLRVDRNRARGAASGRRRV